MNNSSSLTLAIWLYANVDKPIAEEKRRQLCFVSSQPFANLLLFQEKIVNDQQTADTTKSCHL